MAFWRPDTTLLRNFVLIGEAGCGKSEIAVNLAAELARQGRGEVHLFDLDMTKPLFRTRDLEETVAALGVNLHYEKQFMDAPTAAGGVAEQLRRQDSFTVLDVGGDYMGARAIGGYAPWLRRENTAVYYIINPYRPWSDTLEHIDGVLGQVLTACRLGVENVRLAVNPNLGEDTAPEDVLLGLEQVQRQVGRYKSLEFSAVEESLVPQLESGLTIPMFPIRRYLRYQWNNNQF